MSIGIQPYREMSIEFLYRADSLPNIGRRSTRWQVVESFLRISEGNVDRMAGGKSGVILLVGIPGRPGTGAFYLYEENTRSFYTITFDGQDTFHALNFDIVMMAYDLHRMVDLPIQNARNPTLPVKVNKHNHLTHKSSGVRKWHRARRNNDRQSGISVVDCNAYHI